tara:strand:- start:13209 stop:13913 length:705 start_codon:yes stop_codon:yes gene_type:complete
MMGYASHKRWINGSKQMVDELAINPEYFLGHPLLEVMQTLAHEQCHIWQYHFGTPSRRTYHNREWADKMESIGLMPSTTGRPGGRRTGQSMNDYVIYGGAFQKAFYELRDRGFSLPWLDRRPHPPQKHAAGVYDREGNPALSVIPDQEAAVLQEHLGVVFAPALASDEEIQHPAGAPEPAPDNAVLLPVMPVAAKKATRIKYRCPGCGNQAWGKPAMALVCGDCETPFNEIHQD